MSRNSGIALMAVMLALVALSTVALGLAASLQVEARIETNDFEAIQAEQLARSGQEFASFLESRGLSKGPDFLAGLPFEAVTPGFHYRAHLATGTVEFYFESENGKINPSSAPPELVENFFALWTGDATQAQAITAAITDWRSPGNSASPSAAGAEYYLPFHYSPRHLFIGAADLPLIRGLSMDDFQLRFTQTAGQPVFRQGLDAYVTASPVGNVINPNFAPDLVLRSIPGLSDSQAASIVALRRERLFEDTNDLQARVSLPPGSPAWRYLTLSRSAPAVFSAATLRPGGLTRSERRVVYSFSKFNYSSGEPEFKSAIGRVQRQVSIELP